MRPCEVDERRTKGGRRPAWRGRGQVLCTLLAEGGCPRARAVRRPEDHGASRHGLVLPRRDDRGGRPRLRVALLAVTAISRNKRRPIGGRCGASTRTGRPGGDA